MNIASFEGYSPLDVFESDMVIESLKDLGIAFGAAALGAIASYEALAQIPYGSLEGPETKDKILGYARPFLPAVLGGVVGYFLKDYHAPAGYGLMGAGAALTAGLWYQHFRKGEGSKIPFQFTPHKEEMGGMIPALVPQFAGQQVGLVPQFAGYNEYSPENAIVL